MDNLSLLIPQKAPETDTWTWATVTTASPLAIRLDGDSDPLSITPECLFDGAKVGQRVWTQITGRRVIVHAPSGGVKADGTPVGVPMMWLTETPPENYLIANGGTFDSRVYPELAALFGDRFGVHSGYLYHLPDMRQKFPLGGDTSVGSTGGSKKITEANLPAHTHAIDHDHPSATTSSNSHSHTFSMKVAGDTVGGGGFPRVTNIDGNGGTGGTNYTAGMSTVSHTHTLDVPNYSGDSGSTGSGTDYLPPYMTVNFIIKAK